MIGEKHRHQRRVMVWCCESAILTVYWADWYYRIPHLDPHRFVNSPRSSTIRLLVWVSNLIDPYLVPI